jgi:capsular exopolysaccharide synthesis family protein
MEQQQILLDGENEKGFDMKRLFGKLAKNFYWFLIAIALFVTGAYFFIKFKQPLYEVKMNVQIKLPSEGADKIGSAFDGGGSTGEGPDVSSEILRVQSYSIVGEVVDSMKLHLRTAKLEKDAVVPIEVQDMPVAISLNRQNVETESLPYKLTLDKTNYTLESDEGILTGQYNKPLLINGDQLIISPKEALKASVGSQYEFQYLGRQNTIKTYVSRINAEPSKDGGPNILEVAVRDEVPSRAKEFINVLVYHFDLSNLDYNNQALRKELAFLNERLITATQELEAQTKMVRDFKATNQVFDVATSANQLLGNLPLIDAKKTDNMLKSDLLNLVEGNIKSYSGQEEIVPNSSGLQDPVLADQINKYNQLVLQKRAVQDNGAEQDPRLPSINGQMQELRTNILKSVQNIRKEVRATSNSLASQERTITGRFSSMPAKEKELAEMNRVLDIKHSLYTFLLQKTEDKKLELAANEIVSSRIIDNGANNAKKLPDPLLVYAIALGAGILLPLLVILTRFLMNQKVETRQDVESLTSLPIIGEIGNISKDQPDLIITPTNVSSEAEQFRTLRTNISYMTLGIKQKTLLITSSKSGEGKSFVSLNLANSIAISNKKVALLEFDMRNPGLASKLGAQKSVGIANYLMGEVSINEIIQPVKDSENLFFLSCGYPLPEAPGELILNEKVELLFDYLKQNFDVVVIDTPPVGPVSDALTLGRFADISFFVIRHKHTLRSTMKLINKLNDGKKLPRLTLIINGVKDNKEFSYGNDFGYGYGYQSETAKKKGITRFIINKDRSTSIK